MSSRITRLDRFINQSTNFSLSDTRLLVAQKRIIVDGEPANSVQQQLTGFNQVVLDGEVLQEDLPVYLMLHKPKAVVSATKDSDHTTVLELINHHKKSELHIVGRLDLNTTGLLLLTNDGAWSRGISSPEANIEKTYELTVTKPLTKDYVTQFEKGIYFGYEDITTRPARLEILTEYSARLSIVEGKYHQVKRMFGFFQNEVLSLHRISVGALALGNLSSGQSRILTDKEVLDFSTINPR